MGDNGKEHGNSCNIVGYMYWGHKQIGLSKPVLGINAV